MVSKKNISDLPNEILLEIVSHLPEDKINPPENDIEYKALRAEDWQNQNQPPMKTLRVVNKRFNELFTPILFNSILLMNHPDSWWNFNLVALSWLAPFVTVLKVSVLIDLPVYNKREWEDKTPYERRDPPPLPAYLPYRNIVSPKKQVLYTNPAARGSIAKLDLSSKAKAYERYKYWADGESIMREHYKKNTTPVLLFGLMSNLQRFTAVGLDTLANVKVKLTTPRQHHRRGRPR